MGICGDCHEPVRVDEVCCGFTIGWINPADGLAWQDYEEYAVAVGGGRMIDARRSGEPIPDWVLELPSELFDDCVAEADLTDLLRLHAKDALEWTLEDMIRFGQIVDRIGEDPFSLL